MALKKVDQVKIIVDDREVRGRIVEELFKTGVQLDIRHLEVADYIVSDRVGIEFKSIKDFEASIIDGRLFKQCEELIDNFDRPVLLIEGECLFHGRIHPNAVRGAIASITTDYGIPVINVDSPAEAANLIIAYARREQSELDKVVKYNAKRKAFTDDQFQEAIISAFPQLGVKLAQALLEHFGSVKKVVNATLTELKLVEGIGEGKAKRIFDLVNKKYKKQK
jgi:Fanconi anemia group M protein